MIRAIALAVLAACVSGAMAQSSAVKPEVEKGQAIAAKVCAACHGPDGNSPTPINPKLAGQFPEYVSKQLANFKANSERKNPVMLGMSAALSPQDMKNLGAYFEGQKPKTRAAKNPELVKLGQQIYRGGIMAKGVAACASCHGPTGAGIPAQFPRVAGQFAEYTLAQLQAFRLGERANDPNQMMRVISARLSDQEIKAVSEYIAGLR